MLIMPQKCLPLVALPSIHTHKLNSTSVTIRPSAPCQSLSSTISWHRLTGLVSGLSWMYHRHPCNLTHSCLCQMPGASTPHPSFISHTFHDASSAPWATKTLPLSELLQCPAQTFWTSKCDEPLTEVPGEVGELSTAGLLRKSLLSEKGWQPHLSCLSLFPAPNLMAGTK